MNSSNHEDRIIKWNLETINIWLLVINLGAEDEYLQEQKLILPLDHDPLQWQWCIINDSGGQNKEDHNPSLDLICINHVLIWHETCFCKTN